MNSSNISNNVHSLILSCQQKYQDISHVEIKDHYYLIATAVSTAAFTAFQLYAPITSGLCTIALTTLNAHQFVKAMSKASIDESGRLKKWMMVSCLVTSSVLGVYAVRSFPLFVTGMQSLLILEAPWSVFCFTIVTGALGFGLSLAKSLYERGLELFKSPKWEGLENYLTRKFKETMHLHDRLALFLLMMMPELVNHEFFSKYVRSGFYFLPEAEQDFTFEALLKETESAQSKRFYFQDCLQPMFLALSKSLKIKYYPHLVNLNNSGNTLFTTDFKAKIPSDCILSYSAKRNEIETGYHTLLNKSKLKLSEMTQKIAEITPPKPNKPLSEKDSKSLDALKEQLSFLREHLKNFMSESKLYCPTLSLSEYHDLYIQLLSGKFQQELQKLISKQASVSEASTERLDLEETIGNYILMNYSNEDPQGGLKLFNKVAERFHIAPQDENKLDKLEEALKPLGIETVGRFINVIFSGQKKDLSDSKIVLEKLDTYLKAKEESQHDFRGRMYTALSRIKALSPHSTQMVNIASKVTYRAVMILSTIAPIIFQPEEFAMTFVGTVVCNLTYTVARDFIPQKVRLFWDFIKVSGQINALIMAVHVASRRPFLNLFASLDYIDYETYTYLGADFFAKMRILSMELFYGTLVSYFTFGDVTDHARIGGFIAGVAVGNEATELIQKAWKKLT